MIRQRIFIRVVIGCCIAAIALIVSAPAGAATLRATGDGYRYTAGAGEANLVTAVIDGRNLVLTDPGAAGLDRALPAGCTADAADAGIAVRCDARGDQTLKVELGNGDDSLAAYELPRRISLVVDAGSGINVVEGGSGDDRIVGGADRDTLYGGPGADRVEGGGGSNWLRGNGGDDVVIGGSDFDTLYGDGGEDEIQGGGEFDYIYGGGGDDEINGGAGGDTITAGKGADHIVGGAGDDEIRGGKGADSFDAGPGDDLLRARDGEGDTIKCGAGADVARVDAGEVDQAKRDCETVKQADTTFAEPADEDVIS